MVFWLHINLKKQVFDGINRTNVKPLIYRTAQGSISNIINYSVAKFVPSSIIAVFNQISPIATVVLAYFILKEVIKVFDGGIMVCNLIAILITILGSGGNADHDLPEPNISMYIIYIVLLINPFLSSGGTIAMRKMKKFSEYTVSWYLNWSIGLTSLVVLAAIQYDYMFTAITYFDWKSWVMISCAGVCNVI